MKRKKTKPEPHSLREVFPYPDPTFTVDPFGSYTGVPLVEDEVPVQDADDL